MTIGKRIREARESAQPAMTARELATRVGLAPSTLYDLERGDSQSTTKLHRIAEETGVYASWLETGKGQMRPAAGASADDAARYVFLPRISGIQLSAANGQVIWDHEEIDKSHAFPHDWMQREGLESERCKLFEVTDRSMEPTINKGDLVMINMADREVMSGEIYALVGDDGVRAKRIFRRGGQLWMMSDNQDKRRFPDEPMTSEHAVVIGRAVWRSGKL